MIEVKDVKNVDKDIKDVTKKRDYSAGYTLLLGFGLAGIILFYFIFMLSKGMPSLEVVNSFSAFSQIMLGTIGGTAILLGTDTIKCKLAKNRINKLTEEIKKQTGVELELDDIKKSIVRVEEKSANITDKENTNNIKEDEIIRRFYMLDKNEQLQVLEFSRKVVLDSLGKTKSQTLHVYEEKDKKNINFVEVEKKLKFVPAKVTFEEDKKNIDCDGEEKKLTYVPSNVMNEDETK